MRLRRTLLGLCFVAAFIVPVKTMVEGQSASEAPAGFDNQTNGFTTQAVFDANKDAFEERETIEDGLGPVYNAQSCAECHQNPVTGGISQVTEIRAGHNDASGNFVDAPGGSLINDRAIDASIQERVPPGEEVRTFRTSLNTLGDGFVECIADETLAGIQSRQPLAQRGRITGHFIQVPLLEAPGSVRGGR